MDGRVFKHLPEATGFPDTSRVNVYGTDRVTFDYNRWTPGTTIKLLNVPWDDSRNVVEWESEEARDQWFDDADGETLTLTTMFNMQPDGSVKVPVTSDVAQRYNYVWVTLPVRTSDNDPLDYENASNRIGSYGYFITDIKHEAPSTTTLYLEVDPFTTYRSHITFTYCQLARGHAPMAASNVDDYLADPAHNNQYLLCDDVNYSIDEQTTKHSEYYPFGAGTKLIMFASTMSPEQLAALDEATDWASDSSDPSYYDTSDRWGHQYGVNGYDWYFGDKDYSDLETPVTTTTGDIIPNGYYMYAIAADEAQSLFDTITEKVPQVMSSIAAMWMVSADMVNASSTTTVAGVTIYVLDSVCDLPDIQVTLSKDMFGYPDEYADITKLYTSPYADLHVSDNDGNEVTIKIETMGADVELHRRVSVAYPYLRAQSFLTGVNGYGTVEYTWTKIDGTTVDCTAWDAQWADYMLQYDIPTYTLHYSGYVDWAYRNQRTSLEAERLKALNSYHTSMRSNNTAYENTLDSTDVTLANTQRSASTTRTNTNASASTAQTNTNASASTAQTNTNASASTARSNAYASAETAQTNTNASASTNLTNTQETNATNVTNTQATNATNVSNTARSNQAAYDNMERTNEYNDATNSAQDDTNRANTQVTITKMRTDLRITQGDADVDTVPPWGAGLKDGYGRLGNELYEDLSCQEEVASTQTTDTTYGITTTASQGINNAANVFGGMMGFGSSNQNSGAHAAFSSMSANPAYIGASALAATIVGCSTPLTTNGDIYANEEIRLHALNKFQWDRQANVESNNAAIDAAQDIQDNNSDLVSELILENASCSRDTTETNIDASNANAEDTASTSNANASRTASTSNSNAARSYDTTVANAARSYNTTIANADRTYDTTVANAERTYDTTVANAERTYDTTTANATRTYDTTNENAEATYDVTRSNAYETREAQEFTAKTALEQAEDIARLTYENNTTDDAVDVGSNSGDAIPDVFMYRGVQFRIRTQPEGCIRQAGDQMLRYGYTFEGAWNIDTLNVMPCFSYWKCEEIWFSSDATIMETARRAIRDIFLNGVTVWSSPDYIGKVGIYDNR